jgi:non-ribosomal peptide synthetase component F
VDVTLGLRVSRRSSSLLQRMLGTFAEDVPFRLVLPSTRAADDVVAQTRAALTAVIDHPSYPYDALNAAIQQRRPTPNGELFTIMVNYLPPIDLSRKSVGATFVPVPRPDTSKYFVNLRLHDGERLRLDAKNRRDKYSEALIRRLLHDTVDEARRLVAQLAPARTMAS